MIPKDIAELAKPLSPLQLDLATVVARLRQIESEGGPVGFGTELAGVLWERVITCDLPRLTGHLSPAAVMLLERAEETSSSPRRPR